MRVSFALLFAVVLAFAAVMAVSGADASVSRSSLSSEVDAGMMFNADNEIDVEVDAEAEVETETDSEIQTEIAHELAVEDSDAPAAAAPAAAAVPAAAPVAPAAATPAAPAVLPKAGKQGKKNATYVALKKDILLTKDQATCMKSKKVRAVVLRTKKNFKANVATVRAAGMKVHAFYTPKPASKADRVMKFTARLANHNITRVWIRLTSKTTLFDNEIKNFKHVVNVASALRKNKKLKVGIFASKRAFRRLFGKNRKAGKLASFRLWLVGKKKAKKNGLGLPNGNGKKNGAGPHRKGPHGKRHNGAGKRNGGKHKKMMLLELEQAPAAAAAAASTGAAGPGPKKGKKKGDKKKKCIDASWSPVISRRKIKKGAVGKDGKPKKRGSICGVKAEVGRRRRKFKKNGKKNNKQSSTGAAAPAAKKY